MTIQRNLRRAALVFICLMLSMPVFSVNALESGSLQDEVQDANFSVPVEFSFDRDNTYDRYLERNEDAPRPNAGVPVQAASYSGSGNAAVRKAAVGGMANALQWDGPAAGEQSAWAEWTFDVPESGLYNFGIKYLVFEQALSDIEFSLEIDGQLPFNELMSNRLKRVWKDAGGITQSSSGNDVRPEPVQEPVWQDYTVRDERGMYKEPFLLYLEKGVRTFRIVTDNRDFALGELKLFNRTPLPAYEEVRQSYNAAGYKPATAQIVKIQAEESYRKSSSTLFPKDDRSSSLTEPFDAYKIRLNTIGGLNWREPGQWISWAFEVPEDGLYKLAFKFQQNMLNGLFTSRKIYIDGEVPFQELESVKFPYDPKWQTLSPGNGDEPYLIYLSKGRHELAMEVTLGELTGTIRTIQEAVFQLNEMYRKVLMITGSKPDTYRDYGLVKQIPELPDTLETIGLSLQREADNLELATGRKGSEVALIQNIARQLLSIADDPETMVTRMDNYRNHVSGLSTWLYGVGGQPLKLDYLLVMPPAAKLPAVKESFGQMLSREFNMFVASFTEDHYSVGGADGESGTTLKVWIGADRDQAGLLKELIENTFTRETGIAVDLQLVGGTLIEATLAGKGPDVALMVKNDTMNTAQIESMRGTFSDGSQPVNFALRGAVVDLTQFDDFGEVAKRFQSSAMVPFKFRDGYYALPETQSYDMMFIRKDIFAELGLGVPQTWEEFYKTIPVVQRNNMQIGFGSDMFNTFLFQRGGRYYKDDLRQTGFDEPEAVEAFVEVTDLFSRYQFPLIFNFYSRFRSGEMPIAISQYTEYNKLIVSAPEVSGLWEMYPLPGIPTPDGAIDRSQHSFVVGCVMFEKTKNKQAAWEFMKWWTSAEVQAKFGMGLEILMGPAARYPTANVEAFNQLPWDGKEKKNLLAQWKQTRGIPEAPGSYYTGLGLMNAFRSTVIQYENPYHALNMWNKSINEELARKRAEFGLD